MQALTPPATAAEYRLDTKKPVDIQSQQFELDEKRHRAIFRGNAVLQREVNALRFTLRAQELSVRYQPADAEAGPGTGHFPDDIELVDIAASGDVSFSASRETYEVKAKSVIFNIQADTITLSGDVVVAKDRNVIKGEHLVIGLTDGKAAFSGPPPRPGYHFRTAPLLAIIPQADSTGEKPQEPPAPGGEQPAVPR
jgi:lipopolysaccharide export system protein LptA